MSDNYSILLGKEKKKRKVHFICHNLCKKPSSPFNPRHCCVIKPIRSLLWVVGSSVYRRSHRVTSAGSPAIRKGSPEIILPQTSVYTRQCVKRVNYCTLTCTSHARVIFFNLTCWLVQLYCGENVKFLFQR